MSVNYLFSNICKYGPFPQTYTIVESVTNKFLHIPETTPEELQIFMYPTDHVLSAQTSAKIKHCSQQSWQVNIVSYELQFTFAFIIPKTQDASSENSVLQLHIIIKSLGMLKLNTIADSYVLLNCHHYLVLNRQ